MFASSQFAPFQVIRFLGSSLESPKPSIWAERVSPTFAFPFMAITLIALFEMVSSVGVVRQRLYAT